ncbi:major pollen allergen Ole e 10 isoform X2 [Humulus lupulus]|uniref:major pollen allergen Ole e 10 isoform X2 n=1 Tax=Humulus lupulus TaxID=3486 RepID=UPI002B401823|nr:major pollen allergen Ole e 10 isoform X2 [Humulus lupulus]
MADKAAALALALPLLLLLLSFTSKTLLVVHGQQQQKTWCVAKASSEAAVLLANIDYACSQSGVDCSIMEKGCPCSSPDTLINRASIAMNLYYQANGRNHWNCHFRNSALVVITDPSYGKCIYA